MLLPNGRNKRKKEKEKRKSRKKLKTTINKQDKTEATCSNRDTYEVRDLVKAKLYRCVSWRLLMFKKENIMQQRHKYNKK